MFRISIGFPEDMEEAIVGLRKKDDWCRLSISEIVRRLVQIGLDTAYMTPEEEETEATLNTIINRLLREGLELAKEEKSHERLHAGGTGGDGGV